MKIMILGHTGLLGNAVVKYFLRKKSNVIGINKYRYPELQFYDCINEFQPEYIINCIGNIPQKNCLEYDSVNVTLPVNLADMGIKLIQPSTDCEFSGNIPTNSFYSKNSTPDATDMYGVSKSKSTLKLTEYPNVRIIRTSIVGIENNTAVSLLGWFLTQKVVNGYTNHFWNGITTIEWAKQCDNLIFNWNTTPKLIQLGTQPISKYELLCLCKRVFQRDINITPTLHSQTINKCLETDHALPTLELQLNELKDYYNL